MARIVPRTRVFKSGFILNETIHNDPNLKDELTGTIGKTITQLRPSGTAKFGDKILDVFTQGDFIESETAVKIIHAKGSRVIVQATTPTEPS